MSRFSQSNIKRIEYSIRITVWIDWNNRFKKRIDSINRITIWIEYFIRVTVWIDLNNRINWIMSTHRVEGKIPCCLAKMSMDPCLQLEAAQDYIGGALWPHLYSCHWSWTQSFSAATPRRQVLQPASFF